VLINDRESIVPDEKRAYEEQAALFYKAENYIDSLEYYSKAAEIEPSCTSLYVHQGHCLRKLKRYGEALASYEYARKMDPQLLDAYHGICQVYISIGKYTEAENILKEVYGRNLQNSLSYNYRGDIYYKRGFFIAALRAFEEAILGTCNAKILVICYYNKALALNALDKYGAALHSYCEALLRDLHQPIPSDLKWNISKKDLHRERDVHCSQGRALLLAYQYKKALQFFDIALFSLIVDLSKHT
jgi:tetratricopeptide (TPR) repeat protein